MFESWRAIAGVWTTPTAIGNTHLIMVPSQHQEQCSIQYPDWKFENWMYSCTAVRVQQMMLNVV